MHLRLSVAISIVAALLPYAVTSADWDVDKNPASFYQLPDPTGWDVYSEWGTGPLASEGYGAANDWMATETAPVTSIHFWGSWKNDAVGVTGKILMQIFSNDTISGGPGSFPRPDEALWSRVITETEYTSRLYTTGDQGWYDPRYTDEWYQHNHDNMYQYNIILDEGDQFEQQAGETYWLMISMDYLGCEWGWKTSLDVQGNSSVFWDSYETWGPHCQWWRHPEIDWKWTQLKTPQGHHDPRTPVDLAFVIVPEPATLSMLALGAAALLRRRRS